MMTVRRATTGIGVALLLAAGGPALATKAPATATGAITVTDAWARAGTASARTGAAYVTVTNTGRSPDRIIAASTPIAEKAELHSHAMDKGVMTMQAVQAVDIQAGKSVTFNPGGLHVMLIGLKQPLTQGSHFPLTLTLEKAGPVAVEVAVQSAAAMGPAGGHQDSYHGDGHGGGHAHPQ
jgi:copper(I)-binding protein